MNFKIVFAFLALVVMSAFASDCISEPETGPCRAYFESYYYQPKTNQCKTFVYGGCLGNGNRYDSREQCEEACLYS